jgi:hypothetical protein
MLYEKAAFYNDYLKKAIDVFYGIIREGIPAEAEVQGVKVTFTYQDFDYYFREFKAELKANTLEYEDVYDYLIFEYINFSFRDLIQWKGFDKGVSQTIISGKTEIKFLVDMETDIEYHVNKIKMMGIREKSGEFSTDLSCRLKIYREYPENQELEDFFLDRKGFFTKDFDLDGFFGTTEFDFSEIHSEYLEKFNTAGKIDFFENKLKNFRKLRQKKDKSHLEHMIVDKDPDFEALCMIEIESLNRQLDLELKTGMVFHSTKKDSESSKTITTFELMWKSSDTDLLELMTAMYQAKSLQRRDGQNITRKDVFDFFSQIFGLEIKDPEGKLARATNRKMNLTPYLDSLKGAFEAYSEEKWLKQKERR